MVDHHFTFRYKIIDELKRLIQLDRAQVQDVMGLEDDILDLFEHLTAEQREYLARNFHQVFSINEEAMHDALKSMTRPH